jgi:tripartite-type tricarboxylate transporter receptor subunit TctC
MNLARRSFLQFAGAAASAFLAPGPAAAAQTWPVRPVTLIVPYPPGGPTDVLARVLAEQMRGVLGQPLIIENIAGAEGSIGVARAARAKADGYTIELGAMSTHILNAVFHPLPHDVLNDFAPILPLVTTPQVLFARNTIPAGNLKELIAWLKASPTAAVSRFPPGGGAVPAGNGHATDQGAVPHCKHRHAGPDGRPDRSRLHDA